MTPDDEVIVVASGSRPTDSLESLCRSTGARLVRCNRSGAARARNVGIRHARGEIIAFTDDDVTVGEAWLDALVSPMSDPKVSAVVGPVFVEGSNPETLLFVHDGFDASHDRVTFSRDDHTWFEAVRFGSVGSGANLAVRRTSFEKVGPFREGLGAGAPISGDECYYLLSLVDSGEMFVNEPGAKVWHSRQSDDRLAQLERLRVPYVMYVSLTRPWLIGRISKAVVQRSGKYARETPVSFVSKQRRPPTLVGAALAPALVLAALAADVTAAVDSWTTGCLPSDLVVKPSSHS